MNARVRIEWSGLFGCWCVDVVHGRTVGTFASYDDAVNAAERERARLAVAA